MNGIRYVLRRCAWRMLPHVPPWRITFHYFRTFEMGPWSGFMKRCVTDAWLGAELPVPAGPS